MGVIYCLSIPMLVYNDVLASGCIILISLLDALPLDTTGPNSLWGTLVALFILGMKLSRWVSFPMLLMLMLMLSAAYQAIAAPQRTGFTSLGSLVSFDLTLVFAYFMGIGWRWKEENDRQIEMERKLSQLSRNTIIASTMHDAVSARLSRVAILAQNTLPHVTQTDEKERWAFVASNMEKTLDDIRSIIDQLDGQAQGDTTIIGTDSLAENIAHLANTNEARLHQLSFNGKTVIKGNTTAAMDSTGSELVNFIQELYTNIELHCDPTCSSYHITVVLAPDRIIVSQTNGLERSSTWMEPASTGKGLKLHRKTIRTLGGTLQINREHGEWTVYAAIPMDIAGDNA
jgi:signal transduction histidine kinase